MVGSSGKKPSSSQEVLNEIIWNNKFLCVEKRSVYRKDLIDLGFLRIGDLISVGSSFSLDFLTPLISPEQRFFLMSIINSIPAEWRTLAKTSTNVSLLSAPIPSTPTIKTDNGNFTAISDVSSKQIYQLFIEKKQIPPTAKQKLQDKYSDTAVDWEKVYSLAFNVTLESKLREFQYKTLNCIVYTNEKLFRFSLTDSPCCTFCQEDIESIEHFFFSCKRISTNFLAFHGFSKKFPFKGNFHDFSANFQGTYCFIPPEILNDNSRWMLTSPKIARESSLFSIVSCEISEENPLWLLSILIQTKRNAATVRDLLL